jgi:hypothetical protein
MWKQLKRMLLALFLGSVITFLPLVLVPILFGGMAGVAESPFGLKVMEILAIFLYWPDHFLRFGGLNCPNADEIADKLTCVGLGLAVDVVMYSALCFVLLSWFASRKRASRMTTAH